MAPSPSLRLLLTFYLFISLAQVTDGCYDFYNGYYYCVYGLWYFWFGLGWLIIFIIIGCGVFFKKRQRNRMRVREVSTCTTVAGTTSTNTNIMVSSTTSSGLPPVNQPVQPPPYGYPGVAPPAYSQAAFQMGGYYPPPAAGYGGPAYPPEQGAMLYGDQNAGPPFPHPNGMTDHPCPAYPLNGPAAFKTV